MSEIELLRRTERAMLKAMRKVKLMDSKNTKKLMQVLDITVPIERIVRAASVRWYGHVLH